jgi:hypothetical protein
MQLLAVVFLIVPIVWLYAEFKLGRTTRICLGLLSLVAVGLVTYSVCSVFRVYESAWHRTSIRDAAELLRKGDTNRVQRAFDTYNSMVVTGSTFRASEKMMQTFRNDLPQ